MTRFNKLFLVVVVVFIVFYLAIGKNGFRSLPESNKDHQYMALFAKVASTTDAFYLDEVAPAEKFPAAYTAMLDALDRTAAYLDPGQTRIYGAYETGMFHGCGIYGARLSNYYYISDVTPGSPAEKAGLAPGDRIRAVNGESLFGQSLWQMQLALVSEKPAELDLLVQKRKAEEPAKISLETRPLVTESGIEDLGKGVWLVKLSRFDAPAVTLLREKLTGKKNLKLIIDLRRYAGGDFQSFLELTGLFFKEKAAHLFLKKKEEQTALDTGSKEPLDYKRVVVIINKSTIMYGELLAALFKTVQPDKNPQVTLMGRKTPGFVSQLQKIDFDDGSALLLPVGVFLIDEKPVNKSGITPDLALKLKEFKQVIPKSISILDKN